MVFLCAWTSFSQRQEFMHMLRFLQAYLPILALNILKQTYFGDKKGLHSRPCLESVGEKKTPFGELTGRGDHALHSLRRILLAS